MDNLLFAINGVMPIFIMVAFGYFLKKKKIINDEFSAKASKLTFFIALPAMLFRDVSTTDIGSVFDLNTIIFFLSVTILTVILLHILTAFLKLEKTTRGAFIQGVMRSNFAIFGLSIAYNLFGQEGLTKSAFLLAISSPLINILSVIILTVNSPKQIKTNIFDLIRKIIKNPFVIAIVAAIPFSVFRITIPAIAMKTIEYTSAIAIPLALIGIGSSFSFDEVKKEINLSLIAVLIRNIIMPVIIAVIIFFTNFRGADAGVLFIYFAAPTAISSFIMAKEMGSNSKLASNIVLMSTIGSILTMTLGVYIFKSIKLI